MLKRVAEIAGWLGSALVFSAVAVRFLRPGWERYASWMAWAGLVFILLYTLGQWREIGRFFARRQARLGTVAALSIAIVLGILVAINYIASRENKRWDLTSAGEFTLSDQTKKVLAGLDAPLKFTVFAQETDFSRFRQRLPEYEYLSSKVSTEYVDPDKRPAVARQYQVQSYGTVVIEYKGRVERVVSNTEQDLTNGIIKVVTGQQKKLYFVQGHGERDTVSAERTGYNAVVAALGRDNYTVDKLVLAQQTDVPADASVVVVAGPQRDFLPQEVDMLQRYLEKGGKVLALIDPPAKADDPPLPNLFGLLRQWDFEIGNNVVVDVSGVGRLLGTDASVPVAAPPYPAHAITDGFNLITAFPLARSVTPIGGGQGGRSAQSIVQTGAQSWAETDVKKLLDSGEVQLEEDKGDKKGPISIAAAVTAPVGGATPPQPGSTEAPKAESRLVVVGDSDFGANFALGIQGNRDLFLNIVSWLAQQENLISIRPHESEDRRITLTADQQTRISWLSLLIIPGLIIGTGVYTWWRRR